MLTGTGPVGTLTRLAVCPSTVGARAPLWRVVYTEPIPGQCCCGVLPWVYVCIYQNMIYAHWDRSRRYTDPSCCLPQHSWRPRPAVTGCLYRTYTGSVLLWSIAMGICVYIPKYDICSLGQVPSVHWPVLLSAPAQLAPAPRCDGLLQNLYRVSMAVVNGHWHMCVYTKLWHILTGTVPVGTLSRLAVCPSTIGARAPLWRVVTEPIPGQYGCGWRTRAAGWRTSTGPWLVAAPSTVYWKRIFQTKAIRY